MTKYETIFLTRPDLSANQNEKLTADFIDILENNESRVKNTEYCGLRSLAYPIEKNKKAHYTLLNIEATPAAVQEMERNMRLNEDVLRYLTVQVEEFAEGPSALSYKAREYRKYDSPSTEGTETGESK